MAINSKKGIERNVRGLCKKTISDFIRGCLLRKYENSFSADSKGHFALNLLKNIQISPEIR
jgi:hypothetical protein